MEGLRFKYMRAAPKEPDSHAALLRLANQATYAADVYRNLEEFFSRQGYRDDADQVFIASKHREQEFRHGVRWLGIGLLEELVGYGRSPLIAALNCAFIVALGSLLFSRKRMERRKPEEVKESDDPLLGYSRLWYSLGLFLPFVDLQSDKVWRPKNDQRILRHYMRFHILLGWVLVPFFLTTLALLIK